LVLFQAILVTRAYRGMGFVARCRKDSVYRPIERKERRFNALKIPKAIEANLPFKSKPKAGPTHASTAGRPSALVVICMVRGCSFSSRGGGPTCSSGEHSLPSRGTPSWRRSYSRLVRWIALLHTSGGHRKGTRFSDAVCVGGGGCVRARQLNTVWHDKQEKRKSAQVERRSEHLKAKAIEENRSAQRRKEMLKKIHREKGQEEKRRERQSARQTGQPEPKRRKQRSDGGSA
jgi:hypothetical protein